MKVIIADDYEIMSREAAKVVAAEIEKNPDCVLALPTGGTPSAFTRNWSGCIKRKAWIFPVSLHSISMSTGAS